MSAGCRKVGAKVDGRAPLFRRGVAAGPYRASGPVVDQPTWGPHCGQLGAQIDATRSRDRAHCSLRVAADATMHIYRRGENERAWRDHFMAVLTWEEGTFRLNNCKASPRLLSQEHFWVFLCDQE
jgi:hypothetical protein